MTAKPRGEHWLVLGCGLTLGAAWLLYVGTSFVSAWLAFESRPRVSPTSGITCACPLTTGILVQAPSPLIVVASYVVAIPAAMGIAILMHRELARLQNVSVSVRRALQIACDLVWGAMTWITALFAVGFAFSAPDQSWQFAVESALTFLALASFLAVPLILGGVGVAVLHWSSRRRLRSRPQVVHG